MGIIWQDGEEDYKGFVLSTGEHNYSDDSDFYAYVWIPEKCQPSKIIYDTTRRASTGARCVVDATLEVREAYED
jgi:hypothetical protein